MIQQCTLLSNPVEQNWLFHITGTLLSLTVSRHDKNTQQHQSTGHLLLWRKFTRSVHCTAHGDSGLSVALTVIEIISFAPCNIQILLGVVTSTYASWVAHVKALNLYIYMYINKWTMAHSKMVPKFWYLCTIFTMWISSNYFDIYTTWVICIYTIQQLVEETNHTKNIPHLCTSSNINWFEIRLTGLYEIKGIKRAVTSLVWITTKTPCKSLSY